MTKIISGAELRAKLMARKDEVVSSDAAWLSVLGTPGHRALLLAIERHAPQSVGELSALVDRAQPNVSRSLAALIRAGLVTIVSKGRVSVPTLSALGQDKLGEILNLEPADKEADGPEIASGDTEAPAPYLFVSSQVAAGPSDRLYVNAPIHKQVVVGASKEGLHTVANRLIDHWWRIWCRRDAPFKVGAFSSDHPPELTLLFRSIGSRIERILRLPPDLQPRSTFDFVDSLTLQKEVIQSVFRPLAITASKHGSMFDESFTSKLSRLDDSYTQPAEHKFCRTAGAMQLSPYDLTNEAAELVRGLIVSMPEEDARLDFASAMNFEEIDAVSKKIHNDIEQLGGRNSLEGLPSAIAALGDKVSGLATSGLKPWQKGTAAAKALREHLQLGVEGSVGGAEDLARLCGAESFVLHDIGSQEILAFQEIVQDAPAVLVQKEWGALSSAFFLARAVGDYLVFQSRKSCVASKYTDRQAVGRAFAAEFMAPAEGVVSMIDEDERSMTAVAKHYAVSVDVVRHQYQNNYAIS